MRLFISVDVPKEILVCLKGLLMQLPPDRIKVVHHFHLTMRFLGEVDDKYVDELRRLLRKVDVSDFTLDLTRVGQFPLKGMPRVVWVGIAESKELKELHNQIMSVTGSIGEKEGKSFHPHLTLARVKSGSPPVDIKHLRIPGKMSFHVGSFKLYKSTLDPTGPIYEVIEEFEL